MVTKGATTYTRNYVIHRKSHWKIYDNSIWWKCFFVKSWKVTLESIIKIELSWVSFPFFRDSLYFVDRLIATMNFINVIISTKQSLIHFHLAWAYSVWHDVHRSYECFYWNLYIPVWKREICPSWLYSAVKVRTQAWRLYGAFRDGNWIVKV